MKNILRIDNSYTCIIIPLRNGVNNVIGAKNDDRLLTIQVVEIQTQQEQKDTKCGLYFFKFCKISFFFQLKFSCLTKI